MNHIVYRLTFKFILGLAGILLIGSLPALFDGIHIDLTAYFEQLSDSVPSMLHPESIVYTIEGVSRSVFPKILDLWQYTTTVLVISFILSFLFALILAYTTMLLPRKIVDKVKFALFVLESMPDVLVITIFQIIILWFLRETGVYLFYIVEYGDHQPLTLPVVALSILPTIFLYRIIILDFEDESHQPYVEMAKSKGLTHRMILLTHVLRNALISIFLHSRYIFWFMLSNLLVVEYIFDISGLFEFLLTYRTPDIFTLGLLMFFLPMFVVLACGQIILEKFTARKVVI